MSASATWEDWSCRVRLAVTRLDALDAAREHLSDLMADVARSASRFEATSDLCRINGAPGRMVDVAGRTVALVDVALDAAAETGGLVDPTVGAHLESAGYDTDIAQVREVVARIGSDAVRPDWRQVRVDHERRQVGVPSGLRLDLGATAKPWTADVAAHTIAATHGVGVMVEIGGDVAVAGQRPLPWQIQVGEVEGGPGEQVGLRTGGLATSSTIGRTWRTDHGPAHHLIDPRTGRPARGPWRTVSVWAPSAVAANTVSTAAVVLGSAAVAYLAELELPARLVDREGGVHHVGDWPRAEQAA